MTGPEQFFFAVGALVVGLLFVGGIGYLRKNKGKGKGGKAGQKQEQK